MALTNCHAAQGPQFPFLYSWRGSHQICCIFLHHLLRSNHDPCDCNKSYPGSAMYMRWSKLERVNKALEYSVHVYIVCHPFVHTYYTLCKYLLYTISNGCTHVVKICDLRVVNVFLFQT